MPPNVVVIHTDDTGRYIEPYGHPPDTPRLQQLAANGIRFRNAFCASPKCSPSRGALMTGEPPHSNGLLGVTQYGWELDRPERHLATYLAERGYITALCGQQHESSPPGATRHEAAVSELGYTTVPDHPDPDAIDGPRIDHDRSRRDHASARAAAEFIRSDPEDPYFLSVGFYNTHRPFPDPDEHDIDPDDVRPPGGLPDTPDLRAQTAGLHALLREVDRCTGTVLDALADAGVLDETLVVVTTDHGLPFITMKDTLYDGGIGVSLLMRFPEGYRRDESIDAPVSQLDFFPTLCDYLGVDHPRWLTGTSLLPMIRDGAPSPRDAVFAEHHFADFYDPKRCVRTDRYKLIRFYPNEGRDRAAIPANPPPNDPPSTDISWGGDRRVAIERGIHHREQTAEVLFDCYYDPEERVNLADDPTYGEVRNRLSTRLDEWMERTDDPLVNGPIDRPDGVEAWEPD